MVLFRMLNNGVFNDVNGCIFTGKEDFFKKKGVAVMSVMEIFDFVIDPTISDESVDEYLEKAQQKVLEREYAAAEDDTISPTVFVQTLNYVKQCEADLVNMATLQRPSLAYEPTTDAVYDYDKPLQGFLCTRENTTNGEEDRDSLSRYESCSSVDEEEKYERREKLAPEERKAARKENKKMVKKEKREARKARTAKIN